MAALPDNNLRTVQAVFMAPILTAFVIGSLPVLLPFWVYRKLASRRSVPAVAEIAAPAPEARQTRGTGSSKDGYARPAPVAVAPVLAGESA